MLGDARDSLESEIVDYAIDYDRPEYARSTRWPEIETALTAFESAVRADQIEKDAVIAATYRKGYSQHPDDKPWEAAKAKIAAAIRAQLQESTKGETNE